MCERIKLNWMKVTIQGKVLIHFVENMTKFIAVIIVVRKQDNREKVHAFEKMGRSFYGIMVKNTEKKTL